MFRKGHVEKGACSERGMLKNGCVQKGACSERILFRKGHIMMTKEETKMVQVKMLQARNQTTVILYHLLERPPVCNQRVFGMGGGGESFQTDGCMC